jgi:hypothetical protein
MMMYAVHVLYLGPIALHGMRILKFAAFWAAFFVLVGLFEEFLLRGYLLFTIAQTMGVVMVQSEPEGASITVDDQRWPAPTPARVSLPPGSIRIASQSG